MYVLDTNPGARQFRGIWRSPSASPSLLLRFLFRRKCRSPVPRRLPCWSGAAGAFPISLLPLLLCNALWLARIAPAAASSSLSSSSSSASSSAQFRVGDAAAGRRRARVLLVGSGRMGQIRARILHSISRVELVGIVDADAESAGRLLADLYGGSGGGGAPPPAFGSISEAVRELQADHEEEIGRGFSGGLLGCVVCAPTSTHGQLIREAADRGLSVFVEKPVAERPLEVAELFDRCEAAGVRLCCGFQRRFDPSYVAAREVIRSGTIGTPLYAHLFFADHPLPSREYLRSSGGNIFVDLLAHDLDYILDALQDRIDTVYAVAASSDPDLRTAGVQDTATVLLTTRKGVAIAMFLSRGASYGYDQRCEVFGTLGHARVDNHPEHSSVVSTSHGTRMSRLVHSFPQRFRLAFEKEMEAFVDLLLHDSNASAKSRRDSAALPTDSVERGGDDEADDSNGPPCWPVTRSQCVHVQQVVSAAIQSSQLGQVVSVD